MHKNLDLLKKNNLTIELREVPNAYVVTKPWNDETFALIIPKTLKIPNFKDIILYQEFNSIFDRKNNIWEFIFTPEKKTNPILKREFNFNYEGKTFNCSFNKSSRFLKFFAETFRPTKSEGLSGYRNLRPYRDYYSKNKPDYVKEYFKTREPYSFYVKGPLDLLNDKVEFTKTLNFYLSYYDRESPVIQIFPTENIESETKLPCYSLFDSFPTEINGNKIDLTLLDILNVANRTKDIRLEFIFYFQVIEYSAYYYLEKEDDDKLRQILKRPDVNYNATDYIKEIMEVLADRFNINKSSDKSRIEKTIKNFCGINDLRIELEENESAFKVPIEFDGGLKLKELFKDKSAIESGGNGVMDSIINNVSKIRNVVVHLRESRENTVILPTEKNNKLMLPYLYLLRRIAEKVALQFE